MPLLEWKGEYAIGIGSVDFEHRELIELINALHAKLAESGAEEAGEAGEAGEAVPAFLGEIYAKIAAHFALEEREMRVRGYDEYADHKADHERLLDEIREIMDDYELHGAFDEENLAARLGEWFGAHFRTKDARLHKFLG